MRIEVPRSRNTIPRNVPLALWRFIIVLTLLPIIAFPLSRLGATLLGLAALMVVPSLLPHAMKTTWSKRRYLNTPGAIIEDSGVTLYGDGGPNHYSWEFWHEASISEINGKPCIQHLHKNALDTENYQRFSSYLFTVVDYLSEPPERVLELIQSHPNHQKSPEKRNADA